MTTRKPEPGVHTKKWIKRLIRRGGARITGIDPRTLRDVAEIVDWATITDDPLRVRAFYASTHASMARIVRMLPWQ